MQNGNIEPSSPERRTFVKGMAAMAGGVAALLTNTAEAQVPAGSDNRIPLGSRRAEVRFKSSSFKGDKIDWHGFDRYDFVMDKQTLAITPFKAPAGRGRCHFERKRDFF